MDFGHFDHDKNNAGSISDLVAQVKKVADRLGIFANVTGNKLGGFDKVADGCFWAVFFDHEGWTFG